MTIEDVGSRRISLVTGASRGIGARSRANVQLLALGDVVFVGMRYVADFGNAGREFGDRARAVRLDITNAADIREVAGSLKGDARPPRDTRHRRGRRL